MTINSFIEELKKINIILTDEQIDLFKKYADFLIEYNKTTNLTAIRDIEGIYLKHFYDSCLVVNNDVVDFNNIDSLIDIGSGAGFPGVVIKILYPNIKLTLLDSNNKKTTFLSKLVELLNLEDVEIINDRAENYVKNNRHKYDISIARAVSELRIISELCIPLTKVGGYFIALKGNYEEEFESTKKTFEILNSSVEKVIETILPIEQSRRSLIFIKVNKTVDNKYPRSYEQIIKKRLK